MSLKVKIKWKEFVAIFVIYCIWSITVFLIMVQSQGIEKTVSQFRGNTNFYVSFIHMVVTGAIVYFVLIYHIIQPAIINRQWGNLALKIVLFFWLLTTYEFYWVYYVLKPHTQNDGSLATSLFFVTTAILDIIIILTSSFIAFIVYLNKKQKGKEKIGKEKRAELTAIKYQINPHFLFNTLSFIYTKTYKDNPEASLAVHLLSEIMGYMLESQSRSELVPLESELQQMKKIIQINQIRCSHNIRIRYIEDIQFNDAKIPMLTLITLVENAFKHGELHDDNNRITIEITATRSKIYFLVSNKKKNAPIKKSIGIGLSNVRKHLRLVYGIKHSFTVKEDDDYYITEITVNI